MLHGRFSRIFSRTAFRLVVFCFCLALSSHAQRNARASTQGALGLHFEGKPTHPRLGRVSFQGLIFPEKIKYVGFDVSLLSLAVQEDRAASARRVSVNALFPLAALPFVMGAEYEVPLTEYIAALLFIPQMAGNFQVHVPLFTRHVTVFAGQATDFFLLSPGRKIFYETKAGLAFRYQNLGFKVELAKPWFDAYLDDRGFYVGFNVNVGQDLRRFD